MVELAEREARVKMYLKKLGLDKKTDLKVLLVGQTLHFRPVKVGFSLTIIRINPNLSDDEFDRTLAHELLHYLGIPHNETTRSIHFHSTSLRKDLLSKTLAEMMRS